MKRSHKLCSVTVPQKLVDDLTALFVREKLAVLCEFEVDSQVVDTDSYGCKQKLHVEPLHLFGKFSGAVQVTIQAENYGVCEFCGLANVENKFSN
jgi:hypothetical protein